VAELRASMRFPSTRSELSVMRVHNSWQAGMEGVRLPQRPRRGRTARMFGEDGLQAPEQLLLLKQEQQEQQQQQPQQHQQQQQQPQQQWQHRRASQSAASFASSRSSTVSLRPILKEGYQGLNPFWALARRRSSLASFSLQEVKGNGSKEVREAVLLAGGVHVPACVRLCGVTGTV